MTYATLFVFLCKFPVKNEKRFCLSVGSTSVRLVRPTDELPSNRCNLSESVEGAEQVQVQPQAVNSFSTKTDILKKKRHFGVDSVDHEMISQ